MTAVASTSTIDCGCDGTGWIFDLYRPTYPQAPTLDASPADLAAYERAFARVDALRAAQENTVHPCERHAYNRWLRWAEGHFLPDHDRMACQECLDVIRGKYVAPPRVVGDDGDF